MMTSLPASPRVTGAPRTPFAARMRPASARIPSSARWATAFVTTQPSPFLRTATALRVWLPIVTPIPALAIASRPRPKVLGLWVSCVLLRLRLARRRSRRWRRRRLADRYGRHAFEALLLERVVVLPHLFHLLGHVAFRRSRGRQVLEAPQDV